MKAHSLLAAFAFVLFSVGAFFVPQDAEAQTVIVSPNCRFTWSAPVGGGPVEGYTLYIEQQDPYSLMSFGTGMNLQFDCAAANLTPGIYTAWVTAYNVIGESDRSTEVNFSLVVSAPGAPSAFKVIETPL